MRRGISADKRRAKPGARMHTFALDLSCVAGPSVDSDHIIQPRFAGHPPDCLTCCLPIRVNWAMLAVDD